MDIMLLDDWMQMYKKAWREPASTSLSDIFTEDITYKLSPFKEPIKGLEALATFWKKSSSEDGEFEMAHEVVAIEGDRAVVRVDVRYADGDHWKDLWILNFLTDGRCCAFEEWPFKSSQDDGRD